MEMMQHETQSPTLIILVPSVLLSERFWLRCSIYFWVRGSIQHFKQKLTKLNNNHTLSIKSKHVKYDKSQSSDPLSLSLSSPNFLQHPHRFLLLPVGFVVLNFRFSQKRGGGVVCSAGPGWEQIMDGGVFSMRLPVFAADFSLAQKKSGGRERSEHRRDVTPQPVSKAVTEAAWNRHKSCFKNQFELLLSVWICA